METITRELPVERRGRKALYAGILGLAPGDCLTIFGEYRDIDHATYSQSAALTYARTRGIRIKTNVDKQELSLKIYRM